MASPHIRFGQASWAAGMLLAGVLVAAGLFVYGCAGDRRAPKAAKPEAEACEKPATPPSGPADVPPRLAGVVGDADGKPVAGAEVLALAEIYNSDEMGANYKQVDRASSGADGTFVLRAAGGGARQRYTVAARKAGLAIGWVSTVKPDGEGLKIVLGPPVTLAGVVVDEAGKPVAGAEVRASMWQTVEVRVSQSLYGLAPFDWLAAATDARGRFQFANLNRGTAFLRVAAPGYATIYTSSHPQNNGNRPAVKQEEAQPPPGECRIVLPRGSVLRGTVVEAGTRRPVAGVEIHVSSGAVRRARESDRLVVTAADGTRYASLGVSSPASPVVTAADGTFVARNLVEGRCNVRLAGPAEALPDWVLARPVQPMTGDDGLVVEVTKGGGVEVRVTDARSGRPIEGADMTLMCDTPGGPPPIFARTGKDGIARRRGVAAGYVLSDLDADHYVRDNSRRDVKLVDGQVAQVAVQLKPRLEVGGTVVGPDGKPVEGAVLWMETGESEPRTDAAGRFEIFCEPQRAFSGGLVIMARHPGRGLAGWGKLTPAGAPVIQLAPGAEIAGRVVDPEGNGVADVQVSAHPIVMNSWVLGSHSATASTGRDGGFVVGAMPNQADYRVRFGLAKPGYESPMASESSYGATVEKGKTRIEAKDFVLEPRDKTITGVVVDETGKPVAGAGVTAFYTTPMGSMIMQTTVSTAESGPDGTFVLKGVSRREFDINATFKDRHGWGVKAKGGDRDVRMTVRPPETRAVEPKPAPGALPAK